MNKKNDLIVIFLHNFILFIKGFGFSIRGGWEFGHTPLFILKVSWLCFVVGLGRDGGYPENCLNPDPKAEARSGYFKGLDEVSIPHNNPTILI